MLGYDATQDMAQYRTDVHYRLHWSKRKQVLRVVCVQDIDYADYDLNGFVDYTAYDTQADADRALVLTLAVIRALAPLI